MPIASYVYLLNFRFQIQKQLYFHVAIMDHPREGCKPTVSIVLDSICQELMSIKGE